MTTEPGQNLLHYSLVEKIGEGGMGVVWEAMDSVLDRSVAIKILPEKFADDSDRLARFEREAKLIASLNHPNIATVHGLHEDRGVRFLVMELVAGQDLAQRLARGPLSTNEALDVARQIVAALEAAHENGVVHRDVKPANIVCTSDGTVKVLDFGLAKALQPEPAETDLAHSPTMTAGMTGSGTILGTAAYMAPEQARGLEVDKRADIWAFGCVLFEMLTGTAPFLGATVTDVLARILEREPDWSKLPGDVPPRLRRLLSLCFEKDPVGRLRDIGDARIELAAIQDGAANKLDERPVDKRSSVTVGVLLSVLGVILGFAAAYLTLSSPTTDSAVRRTSVLVPPGHSFDQALGIDLSRDGSTLVYSARRPDGRTQIFVRRLDEFGSRAIPNTLGSMFPRLSPDGQQIAYFTESKLYVQPMSGGTPKELCDTGNGWGISWHQNGTIFFGTLNDRGLLRVAASGGLCETVITPDSEIGESWYYMPEVLPGGEWVLFLAATRNIVLARESSILAVSTRTREVRRLLEGADRAIFVEPDRLLFSRGEELFVVGFDPAQPRIEGAPVRLSETIHENKVYGGHQLAASGSGLLAFAAPGREPSTSLVWIDRNGQETTALEDANGVSEPELSPDGSHAALATGWANHQYWILNIARRSRIRLNLDGDNHFATWSPDSRVIAFMSNRLGQEQAFRQPADGSRDPVILIDEPNVYPESWSADGRYLLYSKPSDDQDSDLWIYDLENNTSRKFLATRFNESGAEFSPDGKWVLYRSDMTGRRELYVRLLDSQEGRWTVSTDGASRGVWSSGGREITYLTSGDKRKLIAVDVTTEPTFSIGAEREIAAGNFTDFGGTPNGQRFLVLKSNDFDKRHEIHIVDGAFTERPADSAGK